jgi:FkbM family methyltransferase
MRKIIKKLRNKYWKPSFLYRIYKTLIFSPQKAYSQWGEDILLSHLLNETSLRNKKIGTYVDVGCNNPRIGNNFVNFYKKGWRGINIDMMQWNIRLHNILRKNDINITCGVSDSKGEVDLYSFGATNVLNSLDKDFADKWSATLNQPYTIEKIAIRTLNDIIEELIPNQQIDVLNIDIEGHEEKALAGFDLEKYRPTIILCEIHGHDMEEVITSGVYMTFKQSGYRLISRCGSTCFFVARDFDCGF